MSKRNDQNRTGRQAALVIAGTAVIWVVAVLVGSQAGLSQRMLALFDMLALAGFVWALWLIFQIWRARQDNQG